MYDERTDSGKAASNLLQTWSDGLDADRMLWRATNHGKSSYGNSKFVSALQEAFGVATIEEAGWKPSFKLWQLALADVAMCRAAKPLNHNAVGFRKDAASAGENRAATKPGEERTLPAVEAAMESLERELQSKSPDELIVKDWEEAEEQSE